MADLAPRKYAFIDALRGIAFLGVFSTHLAENMGPAPGMPGPLHALLYAGYRGVPLFFLLSALTLFLSLEARRAESRPLGNFFLRRFFRIAPLFYAAGLFYLACFPGYRNDPLWSGVATPASLLATLTFVHGWWPAWSNQVVPGGWSIAVEMNVYLAVPWLHRRIRRLDSALWCAFLAHLVGLGSLVAAPIVFRALLGPEEGGLAAERWAAFGFPGHLTTFSLGFVLAFLLKDRVACGTMPTRSVSLWMLAVACYLYLMLARFHLGPVAMPLTGVACLLLAWSLALHPWPILVNRATRLLGQLSFGAYLSHFAIVRGAVALLDSGALPIAPDRWLVRLAFLGTLPLLGTLGVAFVLHHLIELPGQALGRRIIGWNEARGGSPAPSRGGAAVVARPARIPA